MLQMKLLIVEDDNTQIQIYERQIADLNSDNDIKILGKVFKNRKEGLQALKDNSFDAAFIDLRLSSSDPEDNANDIIREIRNKFLFPIRVFTGFDDIDVDLKEENDFFKVYTRRGENSKPVREILEELSDIYKTGITRILGNGGKIESYLIEIFWKHFSGSFENWILEAQTEHVEKILLRYTLAHLQEHLDKDDSGNYDEYHPAEVYIIEPINRNIHTGLILKSKKNKNTFIVLTPTCDLVNNKAKKILLAKIKDANTIQLMSDPKKSLIKNKGKLKRARSKKTRDAYIENINEAKIKLGQFSRNGYTLRYHYLPKVNGVGGVIDFQELTSIPKEEIEKDYIKIASVTDKFRKDIIGRFSNLYSRQGQPIFSTEKICDLMLKT